MWNKEESPALITIFNSFICHNWFCLWSDRAACTPLWPGVLVWLISFQYLLINNFSCSLNTLNMRSYSQAPTEEQRSSYDAAFELHPDGFFSSVSLKLCCTPVPAGLCNSQISSSRRCELLRDHVCLPWATAAPETGLKLRMFYCQSVWKKQKPASKCTKNDLQV